jgi:RimJ/RimL family protein N-acetyltransferase
MDAISALQGLQIVGFQTMDVQTTWIFDHERQELSDFKSRCKLRPAREADKEEFVPLAREAYRDTPDRFHADPKLAMAKCDELYAEWIKNSCSGPLADHIVVAEVDGRPAGYTTIRLDECIREETVSRSGGMILSAVAPWAEGGGLYTSMIHEGLRWLVEHGVKVSHLGTQVNNLPVQRAWAKLGFRLAKAGSSMHFWVR